MKLMINGEAAEREAGETLTALLKELGATEERVATVVNDQVVNRRDRTSLRLKDGDRIEILTFAGGG